MKVFILLLPAYLMLLSCLPCRDGYGNVDDISVISQADHTGHHQDESCTPFCTCSCCSITSIANIYRQKQTIVQAGTFIIKAFTRGTSFLPDQYLQSIWQPPRYS